jgi:hypothetical protein
MFLQLLEGTIFVPHCLTEESVMEWWVGGLKRFGLVCFED